MKDATKYARSDRYVACHGDVDVFELKALPKNAKKLSEVSSQLIKHGESGHRHVLNGKSPFTMYEVEEPGIDRKEMVKHLVAVLTAPAELSHEEHYTHVLTPGIYLFDDEKEESMQSGMIERVAD